MQPLSLGELLGILVRDLIVAEHHAAKATADYLREVGFIGGRAESDYWGRVRFITFSYRLRDDSGRATRSIRVPLLSLLPVPLQQIDEVEYEFFAKVDDVTEAKKYLDLLCEVAPFVPEVAVNRRTAIPQVRVKLKMKQADLPSGLVTSLREIEQSIRSTVL